MSSMYTYNDPPTAEAIEGTHNPVFSFWGKKLGVVLFLERNFRKLKHFPCGCLDRPALGRLNQIIGSEPILSIRCETPEKEEDARYGDYHENHIHAHSYYSSNKDVMTTPVNTYLETSSRYLPKFSFQRPCFLGCWGAADCSSCLFSCGCGLALSRRLVIAINGFDDAKIAKFFLSAKFLTEKIRWIVCVSMSKSAGRVFIFLISQSPHDSWR